jgi:hypothetical protein
MREWPATQDHLEDVGSGLVGGHHHHVRTGHHDLADDGVAELEDRVDHRPLGLLDDLVLLGDVDHLAQVILGHERAPSTGRGPAR